MNIPDGFTQDHFESTMNDKGYYPFTDEGLKHAQEQIPATQTIGQQSSMPQFPQLTAQGSVPIPALPFNPSVSPSTKQAIGNMMQSGSSLGAANDAASGAGAVGDFGGAATGAAGQSSGLLGLLGL